MRLIDARLGTGAVSERLGLRKGYLWKRFRTGEESVWRALTNPMGVRHLDNRPTQWSTESRLSRRRRRFPTDLCDSKCALPRPECTRSGSAENRRLRDARQNRTHEWLFSCAGQIP